MNKPGQLLSRAVVVALLLGGGCGDDDDDGDGTDGAGDGGTDGTGGDGGLDAGGLDAGLDAAAGDAAAGDAAAGDAAAGDAARGDGGTQFGEGRDPTGACPAEGDGGTCTEEELADYASCVSSMCGDEFEACLGPNYAVGDYAGPCQDYMECVVACDCSDTACAQGCGLPSTECTTCLTTAGQCVGENCPPPDCAADAG